MSLLRRISSESGSALPVVVGVMLVIGILVSVIHQTSNRVAQTTTKERAEKRAFQAAEAGLHVATYRLNKMLPLEDQCLTTQPYTPASPTTPCPATGAVTVGSGATYRYTVTRPLTDAGSSECDVPGGLDFDEFAYRCITSVGTAGGQTRRVQAFVQIPLGAGLFPVDGIFALGTLSANQNSTIVGELGSNTHVSLGSYSTPAPGIVLAPGATRSPSSLPITETLEAPFPGKVWDSRFAASLVVPPNNNANWPTGGGRFTLNSQWRELNGNNATGSATTPFEIPAGTYNFCSVSLNNETYLRPLGPVKIFIDSPARAGSGCRANTGSFVANNNFTFKSSPADASMIHIEMYGGPGTQFLMKNNLDYVGTLYAPKSGIEFQNNTTIRGAMVGATVSIFNNLTLTGEVPDGLTGADLVYDSQGWIECVRTPSGGSDGSGC